MYLTFRKTCIEAILFGGSVGLRKLIKISAWMEKPQPLPWELATAISIFAMDCSSTKSCCLPRTLSQWKTACSPIMLSIRKFVTREYNRDQGGGVSFLFHFAVTILWICHFSSASPRHLLNKICLRCVSLGNLRGFLRDFWNVLYLCQHMASNRRFTMAF